MCSWQLRKFMEMVAYLIRKFGCINPALVVDPFPCCGLAGSDFDQSDLWRPYRFSLSTAACVLATGLEVATLYRIWSGSVILAWQLRHQSVVLFGQNYTICRCYLYCDDGKSCLIGYGVDWITAVELSRSVCATAIVVDMRSIYVL